MGNALGALSSRMRGKTEVRVIMNGLDASGKTTALYKLKLGEVVTTIPTIGFNVETVQYGRLNLTLWDIGGRDKMRALSRHYYQNTQAVIWVIDSNDRERLPDAMDEMHRAWNEHELEAAVWLVLCNKQDLPNAMSRDEIVASLPTSMSRSPRLRAVGCCAKDGDGLYDGLAWLQYAMQHQANSDALLKFTMPTRSESASLETDLPKLVREARNKAPPTELSATFAATPPSAAVIDRWWAWHRELDDATFVDRIEHAAEADLNREHCNHLVLLRFIHAHLHSIAAARAGSAGSGRKAAVDAIFAGLERFHAHVQLVSHTTQIYFFIQMVDLAMQLGNRELADASFADLVAARPWLLDDQLIHSYYSPKLVFHTPDAVSSFVLPDIKQLPSVLNFNVPVSVQ
nr:Arl17a [Planomonas micra]